MGPLKWLMVNVGKPKWTTEPNLNDEWFPNTLQMLQPLYGSLFHRAAGLVVHYVDEFASVVDKVHAI